MLGGHCSRKTNQVVMTAHSIRSLTRDDGLDGLAGVVLCGNAASDE
jgi:hypothetical protein